MSAAEAVTAAQRAFVGPLMKRPYDLAAVTVGVAGAGGDATPVRSTTTSAVAAVRLPALSTAVT